MPGSPLTLPARPRARAGLTLIELLATLVILATIAGLMVPLLSDLRITAPDGERLTMQDIATLATMDALREAIVGSPGEPGYFQDMQELPQPREPGALVGRPQHPQVRYLFVNPADPLEEPIRQRIDNGNGGIIVWNGPYMQDKGDRYTAGAGAGFTSLYGSNVATPFSSGPDQAVHDAWGNPIVIQSPQLVFDANDQSKDMNARLVSAGPDGVIDTPADVFEPSMAQRGDDFVIFLFMADPLESGS